MRQKIKKMKTFMIVFILVQAVLLLIYGLVLKQEVMAAAIVLILEAASAILLFEQFESVSEKQSSGVRSVLGTAAEEAYLTGEVGLVIYDDNYVITWMSELFRMRNIDRCGRKILTWIPEADDLIAGNTDSVEVTLDDKTYEITRKEDAPVLFFKDITELTKYRNAYHDEHIVLGLASFDNYDESTRYVDEADAANISANIRVPLMEYCHNYGILAKRLGTSKYLLILNEEIFARIADDHFSILTKIRRSAVKMDVSITLSMAFAKGASDLDSLDDMLSSLIDLAETRGGDQVAVQTEGEDVKFFGGSSEAAEKRSRVRVRVMSHALRDLILKSSNVIICGHKTADFDCIGSAICLSEMVTSLNKPCAIIARTGGIEEKLKGVLDDNEAELKKSISFVTEGEALNQLTEKTLVIMTDHHNIRQSNGARVLEEASRVVIIDHHRRSTEMGVKPVLVYIEAGASSTCELLTEMIPYVSARTDISMLEATIMLTGIIVDTQQMKVRTGTRTYDAASALRDMGADPVKAYAYLKDSFDDFALKAEVATSAQRYERGVVIASVANRYLSRSLMSQVADSLLGVEGVEAAFVIADTAEGQTAVSARSAGKINVQMIMEMMGGGGHRTAAALQRTKTSPESIKQEMLKKISQYFEEEQTDESDS